MSQYGFSGRPDVGTAVEAAIERGVHFVVCAGNDGFDACRVQPSNAAGAIVVGSIDGYNKLPSRWSDLEGTNFGKCVTIFAPGSRVPSLSAKNVEEDYEYWSWGTSIATPQIAALVANRLSAMGPQSPAEIKAWLQETATKDQIQGDLKGSPNLIAYTGVGQEIKMPVIVASRPKPKGKKGMGKGRPPNDASFEDEDDTYVWEPLDDTDDENEKRPR
jgi:subtilisin family serine protease